MSNHKKLLAFNGGGIRGILSASWLERLCNSNTLDLDKVYALSGTSTGAIITAALGIGYSPADIVQLFSELSKTVFKTNWYQPTWLRFVVQGAQYDIKKLEEILKSNLGEVTVGQVPRNIAITIWDMDSSINGHKASVPLIVHNHSPVTRPIDREMQEWPLYRVVAGSCAAPTYFNAYVWKDRLGKTYKWTDGGQVENTGAMTGVSCLLDNLVGSDVSENDIACLSFGTGISYQHEPASRNFGWKTPRRIRGVLQTIVQGNETLSIKFLQRMLGPRFHRLNHLLPKSIDLDEYQEIDDLLRWSKECDLSSTESFCRGYFA